MKLGNIQDMLKQAGNIKQQMEQIQNEAGEKVVEATSGGGMVTVVAKAKGEIISIKIEPTLLADPDIEMIQDLITAACNEALNRARQVMKEEVSKVASNFGLPPGLI
ncbi:MAG: YbaB/EbfC family nucleoid-associated protein [Candidatus Dadabacteria bacterium]|nr:YbaB/EbfC family nucleoid-associated protein [Candidatus Dadabacteria bacterium]HSG30114.1 YbaB/EbfC family nucleoid-associated protein [Thermodesulfobacteriota bacterium]NIS08210.1 YbaB/EbfC family nucleoid-associated protein [Candidatus Dadabacteria bacterium]NIV41477.1 YbaB/EbfC family nucleoid-associated protein [Candidatus Dadabacteria bacterium]NIX15120.1 YbaB/EbfC family nucleoid-associated protein [Candidatus Dadabacteria bacterium]